MARYATSKGPEQGSQAVCRLRETSRRRRFSKWAALLLLTTIITYLLTQQMGGAAQFTWDWTVAKITTLGTAEPSCDDPRWLKPVPKDQFKKWVSYAVWYTDGQAGPAASIDGDPLTSFLQPWPIPETRNEQDTLAYKLRKRYNVKMICIIPGAARNIIDFEHVLPPSRMAFYVPQAKPENAPPTVDPRCSRWEDNLKDPTALPSGESPDFSAEQQINWSCRTDRIVAQILGAYTAKGEYRDPEFRPWGGRNSQRLGIAEITFYFQP
jgi:hypothetical protein